MEVTFFFFFSLLSLKCCVSGSVNRRLMWKWLIRLASLFCFLPGAHLYGTLCNQGWGDLVGQVCSDGSFLPADRAVCEPCGSLF